MQKNVLIMALAAATLTTGAQAALGRYSNTQPGSPAEISGSIEPGNTRNPWQWALGDLPLDLTTTDLTNGGKTWEYTATTKMPLLGARTKLLASGLSWTGSVRGISPSVVLLGKDGVEIKPQWVNQPNGQGSLTVPLYLGEDSVTPKGSLVINMTAAGVGTQLKLDTGGGATYDLYRGITKTSTIEATALRGILPSVGGMMTYDQANAWVSVNTQAERDAVARQGIAKSIWDSAVASAHDVIAGYVGYQFNQLGVGYEMGVAPGQMLVANFNAPVTETTKWNAPLQTVVSYN